MEKTSFFKYFFIAIVAVIIGVVAATYPLDTVNKFLNNKVSPSKDSDLKVGVLQFDVCLTKSKHGKMGRQILEDINAKAKAEMKDLDDKIQEVQSKLQEEKDTITEEAKNQLQADWTAMRRNRDERLGKSHSEIYKIQTKIVQKLSSMISQAAKSVCEHKGISAVINSEVCCFYDSALNITEDICTALEALPELSAEDFIEKPTQESAS